MKTIRRYAASIFASIDWLADQVENHEALVTAAIRDVEIAASNAGIQFKRVQADGTRMRQHLNDLRTREDEWREQAIAISATDRSKALECLRRSKHIQKYIGKLEEQERKHATSEKLLRQDLTRLDKQLRQLKRKRQVLRTRESQTRAISAISREDTVLFENIDELFDRWESTVSAQEKHRDFKIESIDFLDLTFSGEGEDEDLNEELDKLLNA